MPPDAEPAAVVAQLNELRALLAREERKRDRTNAELMALQQQLQQVLVDEEMLREQRGGREAPSAARKGAPVALLDPQQYASMHPEEHAELTLGGFKMSYATLGPRRPESQ